MKKSDPSHPPRNWYYLKEMLATFSALLLVLFGGLFLIYGQVLKLWRVLNHPLSKQWNKNSLGLGAPTSLGKYWRKRDCFLISGWDPMTSQIGDQEDSPQLIYEDWLRMYDKTFFGFGHNAKAMEQPRECKHLGNQPCQYSGGKYASKRFFSGTVQMTTDLDPY